MNPRRELYRAFQDRALRQIGNLRLSLKVGFWSKVCCGFRYQIRTPVCDSPCPHGLHIRFAQFSWRTLSQKRESVDERVHWTGNTDRTRKCLLTEFLS